eukprot:m51a1_g13169 hypothetical protein (391) ;mRNA; r:77747-79317
MGGGSVDVAWLVGVAMQPVAIIGIGALATTLSRFNLDQAHFSAFLNNILDEIPWRFLLSFCAFLVGVLALSMGVAAGIYAVRRRKAAALRVGCLMWMIASWTNTGVALLVCEEMYGARGRLVVVATVIGESWVQFPIALMMMALVQRVEQAEQQRSDHRNDNDDMVGVQLNKVSTDNSPDEENGKTAIAEAAIECEQQQKPYYASAVAEKTALFFGAIDARINRVSPLLSSFVATVFHPATMSTIIGTVWVLAGIPWPSFLSKVMNPIGTCYTALALLSTGNSLTDMSWVTKDNMTQSSLYALYRHIVGPLGMLAFAYLFDCPRTDVEIGVLIAMMPVALVVYSLCAEIKMSPNITLACVLLGLVILVPMVLLDQFMFMSSGSNATSSST